MPEPQHADPSAPPVTAARPATDNAQPKRPNLFVRVLRGLWHGVDTFRKVLHLVLLRWNQGQRRVLPEHPQTELHVQPGELRNAEGCLRRRR